MKDLQIFKNNQFGEIRTIEENGKILFCGSDVAKSLGYDQPHKAIERHCKSDGGMFRTVIDTLGREQQAKFINEGNLYRLIANSKLPSAQEFESWVFDEVLPSIRRHGLYATDELLNDPDLAIQAFTALKDERAKTKLLETIVAQKDQIIGELKPKANYVDWILNNKGLVTITQIAKDYGMSGNEMNKHLNVLKVQYKQSGQWLLYAEHQTGGYTHSETINFTHKDGRPDVSMNTKWTQKGRLFIYELLKKEGILPVIERNIAS